MACFGGIAHRFEQMGSFNGVTVIDDYAHHPTAIVATLNTLRGMGYGKIWCVFQPHTYSRTRDLLKEFAGALTLADAVILPDIYTATESDIYGVSSRDLADKIPGATYMPDFDEIAAYLKKNARPGDVVLTMGAGMAYKIGEKLVEDKR